MAGQKICCMCGEDVATRKRVKDAQGRYYCEACQAKARKAAQRVPVAAGAPAASTARAEGGEVMLGDESRPAAPPAEGGELDLAPVREHAPVQEEMFGCALCKKLIPKSRIRNVEGEFLCQTCLARQNALGRKAASAGGPRTGAAPGPAAPAGGGLSKLLLLAGVCVVALAGAGVAAWMLPDFSHDIFFGVAITGSVLFSLGMIWGIYAATSENIALRLACRFIPFVGLVVIIMRSVSDWETMKGPVITMLVGTVMAAAGWMMWLGFIVLH